MSKAYSEDFFSILLQQSVASAEQVIPLVLDYIQPASVVDVGCGVGTWLSVWKKHKIKAIGIDGDYVNRDQLMIEQSEFMAHDLTKKIDVTTRYDLVCSMEVGEHIEPSSADTFVGTLCDLGDVVLFSAAIPGQGGTHHVNEQYPDYWAALFAKREYVPVDCIRKRVWENKDICWWYRQNMIFFVKKSVLANYPKLQKEYDPTSPPLRMVHPELLETKANLGAYFRENLQNPVKMTGYYLKKLFGQ